MESNVFKPVNTKLYKTGQTRGADDDVIYQNRVKRNSTVLIPYSNMSSVKTHQHRMGNTKTVSLSSSSLKISLKKVPKLNSKKKG